MLVLGIYVRVRDSDLPWWQQIPLTVLGCLIAFGILWLLYKLVMLPAGRRLRRRVKAVEAAGGDDPVFGATAVKEAARALYTEVQAAWDAGDRGALATICHPDLLADWVRRMDENLAAGVRYRVEIAKGPKVDYIGLADKPGSDEDYVRVRVRARLKERLEPLEGSQAAARPQPATTLDIEHYWTLSRHNYRWIVFSTRDQSHGSAMLKEEIIAPGSPTA